ncbi:MAG TPA: hypothetical protein VHQ20_02725 [Patescibacteria group bacterium]|jgi:hypothetical protein|nr:hypothetical protein [Patescibacteria group bacterium]
MKYKSLFIVTTAVLLLAAGCNKTDESVNTNAVGNTNANANANASVQNVFTDVAHKISLNYGDLIDNSKSSYVPAQNSFPGSAQDLYTGYVKPESYKGTNLESAWFNLAIRDGSTFSQAQCYAKPSQENISAFTQKRVVQGNVWLYGNPNPSSDAGAGHQAEYETYRLYKNNICYEVKLGLSKYNRQNLENPDSVKEIDTTKIFNQLGAVFNTVLVM